MEAFGGGGRSPSSGGSSDASTLARACRASPTSVFHVTYTTLGPKGGCALASIKGNHSVVEWSCITQDDLLVAANEITYVRNNLPQLGIDLKYMKWAPARQGNRNAASHTCPGSLVTARPHGMRVMSRGRETATAAYTPCPKTGT